VDRQVGVSEAEYLPRILAVTEDLIQLYRRKPQQDWLPGLTLEHLCFHRWIMMAALKGKIGNQEMTDFTGRDKHLILRTLSLAIFAVEAARRRLEASSDLEGMKALLDKLAESETELSMYMSEARIQLIGLIGDHEAR